MMFTNKNLKKLIIPLIFEQLLAVTVGLADSIMVSNVGESAISAVSLVDSINVLINNVFAALATGGVVVAGQYLGKKKNKEACDSTNQLFVFNLILSLIVMILLYLGQDFVLHTVFGKINNEVMNYSRRYMLIVLAATPFVAIYNSGAAVLRTMGNSSISLWISTIMNLLNIVGNAILIYGFHFSIEGVAIPTLVSRIVATVMVIVILRNPKYVLHIKKPFRYKPDKAMIKKILSIGVPSGVENSMFQLGKILLLSLVSSFGTVQITANAVGNTIAGFQILPGMAIGLTMVTIVSRCIGAGDYEQAKYYCKKLMKYAYIAMAIINIIIMAFIPLIMRVYRLSDETSESTIKILLLHGICATFIWPLSFTLPNALRAANDAKFTMIVGISSMWICRIVFGIILGKYFGLMAFGVWIAMIFDWCVRSVFFIYRYRSGKWKEHDLI